jgi:hypothetical protein
MDLAIRQRKEQGVMDKGLRDFPVGKLHGLILYMRIFQKIVNRRFAESRIKIERPPEMKHQLPFAGADKPIPFDED